MNLISIKLLLETVNRCEHFHILLLPSFVISEAVRTRCKRFQAITLLALSTLVCDDTEYHEVQVFYCGPYCVDLMKRYRRKISR